VCKDESAPIQLAQCRFPALAISNAKILIHFQIKHTEAILSNNTPKLVWFEITKMLIAVYEKNIVSFIIIFDALSFSISAHVLFRIFSIPQSDEINAHKLKSPICLLA